MTLYPSGFHSVPDGTNMITDACVAGLTVASGNGNIENTAKGDSRDQNSFPPYSMLKVLLKVIPATRMIPSCVFVMLLVFSILYEMRMDMPPRTEIKTKRMPVEIRSVWESSSRDLLEYATRT